jgi:hypothetical protein
MFPRYCPGGGNGYVGRCLFRAAWGDEKISRAADMPRSQTQSSGGPTARRRCVSHVAIHCDAHCDAKERPHAKELLWTAEWCEIDMKQA